jgi:hypothetical protein
MAMSKFSKSTAALSPSVRENPPFLFFSKVKKVDKVDGPDADKSEWIKLEFLMDPDNPASKNSRQFAIFKDGCRIPEDWIKWVMAFREIENLMPMKEPAEKIRRNNGPYPSSLPVDNKKSVTISVGKSSKHHKGSNMWCHYCDKNNHNTADCRAIAKFKQQKKARFEAKAEPGKKSLAFLFEEINALKRQLKPEKTASSKKRKVESILSTDINLTTSSDEGEEYLFTSSKPFRSSKTKLAKSSHPTINH